MKSLLLYLSMSLFSIPVLAYESCNSFESCFAIERHGFKGGLIYAYQQCEAKYCPKPCDGDPQADCIATNICEDCRYLRIWDSFK